MVPGMLHAAAKAVPETIALILDGDRELTYGRWRERADRFAVALQTRGVKQADRVGLVYSGGDWLDYAVAYFGVLTCGATAVLLSGQPPADKLARLAVTYRLALVVVGSGDVGSSEACAVLRHADLEGGVEPGAKPRPVTIGPDDVAEIIFTSGTQGLSKGVEATHRSMLYRSKRPDPRVLMHPLPLGSAAAQMLMVDAVRGHQTLVVMSEFHPGRFCRLVIAHEPCWIGMAPAVGAMLVRAGAHRRFRLSSVTGVTFVSAPLQPATLGQLSLLFPAATIRNYYSSTEAAPAGVGTVFDPARPLSVGRPDDGCEVRVVDDDGDEVAAGVRGEVLLRAEGAGTRRYADDQAATDQTFRDGWVRTGDIGYLDDDGYLFLVDRRADTINAGGMKISTLEVEHALGQHPSVLEVAVFGRRHPVLGEVVEAAVIVDPESPGTDSAALIRFCAERLARHQVPARVHLVDDFPRNALGKPLKRVLAERAADAGGRERAGEEKNDGRTRSGRELSALG
ncbi:class I adenylate-forming enzyme family protein [Plantactinospora sp. B6F1]|uniref:class I adenylate-forming enzyme family protein n=1 Tax=Plantactinospora sp. B6F1 TaxID=3158971 RepID=UPI0032D90D35